MRNTLLGVVAGLLIGTAGTLAYTHYVGEGQQLVKVQADLDTAKTNQVKAAQDGKQMKDESDALTQQVQQLSAENEALKKQVALAQAQPQTAPVTSAPPANPLAGMGDMIKVRITMQVKQKMIALKSRLHLTPDQKAAVQAAMDDEAKKAEAMFQSGKIDPQALADLRNNKGLDQALDSILTQDQKTDYDKMKSDEKTSQAETMATFQMNEMAPALGLSDAQKDQVYSALTQANLDAGNQQMDPSNPGAMLDARQKATEDALAKVLTPDQLSTYHQQAQSQLEMQKSMMQRFMQGGGGGGAPPPMPPPPPGP